MIVYSIIFYSKLGSTMATVADADSIGTPCSTPSTSSGLATEPHITQAARMYLTMLKLIIDGLNSVYISATEVSYVTLDSFTASRGKLYATVRVNGDKAGTTIKINPRTMGAPGSLGGSLVLPPTDRRNHVMWYNTGAGEYQEYPISSLHYGVMSRKPATVHDVVLPAGHPHNRYQRGIRLPEEDNMLPFSVAQRYALETYNMFVADVSPVDLAPHALPVIRIYFGIPPWQVTNFRSWHGLNRFYELTRCVRGNYADHHLAHHPVAVYKRGDVKRIFYHNTDGTTYSVETSDDADIDECLTSRFGPATADSDESHVASVPHSRGFEHLVTPAPPSTPVTPPLPPA